MGMTITIFDMNDVTIRTRAGMINNGIFDTSTRAPTETKNNAANTSRRGTVMTRAIPALFDSATSTPARNAPITGDNPSSIATKDKPNAKPSITIINTE